MQSARKLIEGFGAFRSDPKMAEYLTLKRIAAGYLAILLAALLLVILLFGYQYLSTLSETDARLQDLPIWTFFYGVGVLFFWAISTVVSVPILVIAILINRFCWALAALISAIVGNLVPAIIFGESWWQPNVLSVFGTVFALIFWLTVSILATRASRNQSAIPA